MWNVLAKPLTGSLVSLEPLEERHLDELRIAASDPRVSRWFPVPLHEPCGFDAWLKSAQEAREQRTEVTFATVRRSDGVAIGSTRFMELRPAHRCVEIGST